MIGQRARDERGAFLVIYAFLLVALIGMVAIVVDLGQARATRRSAQSAADFAALTAGAFLAGQTSGSPPVSDPRGACRAAIDSVKRDQPDFPAATSSAGCDALPLTGSLPNCSNGPNPAATARQTVTVIGGPYVVTVEYPVEQAAIAESRFASGAGADDGKPCERMRVTVRRTNPTFFAGVLGQSNRDGTAASTVKGTIDTGSQAVPALLLLEREACPALRTGGGGTNGLGVIVRSFGTNPGRIAADSAGISGGGCSSNVSADGSGNVIYGTALPNGTPSIRAEPTSDGTVGVISMYSLSVGGRGSAVNESGVRPGGSAGGIASRIFADTKYNSSALPAIRSLHESGRPVTLLNGTQALAAGYTVLGCNDKNGLLGSGSFKVFVDCPTGYEPDEAVFSTAAEVVFNGGINVKKNKKLSFPVASKILVRGGPTSAIDVSGGIYVNTGVTAPPPADPDVLCALRAGLGAQPAGITTNRTVLATFGGALNISGDAAFCQTTVYLGKNEVLYKPQSSITGPAVAQCSAEKPCPRSNAGDGTINVSGDVDWSAPNQLSSGPVAGQPLEDLALWAESHLPASIKGQGESRTEGVYFLPNAPVEFFGQGTQKPLNAQFFARRLRVGGQSTLDLQPNPNDSISIPVPGGISLIR